MQSVFIINEIEKVAQNTHLKIVILDRLAKASV